MALPSAQLGSMSSLSVPSFIPTVQVQKEPKAWEKALLAIVTQAGAQAAQQGVSNAMANDNAAEFGKTPRSGFGKLLAPVVSDQEASRLRGEKSANERVLAQMAGQIGLHELDSAVGPKDVLAQRNAEIGQIDRNMDSMRDTMAKSQIARRSDQSANVRAIRDDANATERTANELEALNQSDRHQRAQEILTRLGQLESRQRAEMVDDREKPYREAQGREQNAKAAAAELQSKMLQQELNRMGGKPGAAAGAVNPNIAKFSQGAGPTATMSPENTAIVELIRQALNPGVPAQGPVPGKPAVPPEQLLNQLSGFLQ